MYVTLCYSKSWLNNLLQQQLNNKNESLHFNPVQVKGQNKTQIIDDVCTRS